MSCVFCDIATGRPQALDLDEPRRVAESVRTMGLRYSTVTGVARPMVRGHTLIIPKTHHVDLTDTPAPVLGGMITLGQRVAQAARTSGLHADGSNVVINDGKAAFQSVFHIHLHVAPRRYGDKLRFATGILLRRDPDREKSGRLLRDAMG